MDLVRQTTLVTSIHDTLNDYVGQRLKVRANLGRSKIEVNEGTLMQVYPSLFVMEVERKRGASQRKSFQHVDVLTGVVELSQNGESLFADLMQELNGTAKPVEEELEEDQEGQDFEEL